MPNRSSKRKKPSDPNLAAFDVLGEVIAAADPEAVPPKPRKNPHAVALGRRGGLKGGAARAAKLSKRKRSEIAKKAARARWRLKK